MWITADFLIPALPAALCVVLVGTVVIFVI